METLYWACLIGGAIFALVSVLFGDLFDGLLEGSFELAGVEFLNSTVIASAITTFGGAGILLMKYTELNTAGHVLLSLLFGILGALTVFFAYIRPARNSEVSTGFSMRELAGKIGEITVPVPEKGYGEVMIKLVSGNTLHTASSFEAKPIMAGTRVVVVEVADGVLRVAELDSL
ncbi:NfeD family protein [Paenibacillus shunpengii]|uniref:NfeD family protein n=1 Tax=Paenibacillus shunpengii TaxID=2054424 RepID=A0ABW5SWP9_9BACL|nr:MULTISPECIES: NfeD family protein [unclassified Paenibacillus]OMC69184.1 protease [Paenibacillus sp. FSL H7-0326]SDX02186.1 NfeD-like C-terminal, partner-binding [Paenibacillus sp. PDC88]